MNGVIMNDREKVIDRILKMAREELIENWTDENKYFYINVGLEVVSTDTTNTGRIIPATFKKLKIDSFKEISKNNHQVSLKEVEVKPEDFKGDKRLLIKDNE